MWFGKSRWGAAAWVLAAVATDILDGILARARGEITDFGKKVDPFVDKLLILGLGLILTLKYGVPWWLYAAAAARDVGILASAAIFIKLKGEVIQADFWGKTAALGLAAYALYVIVTAGGHLTLPLAWVVLGLLIISAAKYTWLFVRGLNRVTV